MRHAVLSLLLVTATPAGATSLDCVRTHGLAVDADGSPDSYRVDGKGLSYRMTRGTGKRSAPSTGTRHNRLVIIPK